MDKIKFGIIIPTLNGGEIYKNLLSSILIQDITPNRILVIDSGSTDGTDEESELFGAELIRITKDEFNHGGTRMLGARHIASSCDIVVFLTQDAILNGKSALRRLVQPFSDSSISICYGRQLARPQAGPIEVFARMHNYPGASEFRSKADIPQIGFKTCFCSNSFAAYRLNHLLQNGGFPDDVIFGEDALAAARIVLNGGRIRYEADATVIHSHSYGLCEEFSRYFDIGVMHSRSARLLEQYGTAESAGMTFVYEEFRFLLRNSKMRIPEAFLRGILKFLAYKLGMKENKLSLRLKKALSMNKNFWKQ